MKKLLLCTLLLMLVALPALGEKRVYDEADLLSEEAERTLETQAAGISGEHSMEAIILTRPAIGYKEPRVYAADFLESIGLGDGSGKNSVILLVSMAERDVAFVTHGLGERIFTLEEQERLLDEVAPYLTRRDYDQAMTRYLTFVDHECSHIPTLADVVNEYLPFILIAAVVITLIVMLVLKSQMKSVRRQAAAASYVEDGSFQLTRKQDIYLYTTTRRRKIETSSGSGSGSSGSFRSSSGGSYSGSSRKF